MLWKPQYTILKCDWVDQEYRGISKLIWKYVTCLVWTAWHMSALFSAALDAPWQPSSAGSYPPNNINGENANLEHIIPTICNVYTCGRSWVRCLSLSVCFRPRRSSSAFLLCMIDRRSWTWKTNCQCDPLSTLSRGISASNPDSVHLFLTFSSCLSRSLCCLCSTFLCMSTRLRIVVSLSTADIGSLSCSLSVRVDSLSTGQQSTFKTGNSTLVAQITSTVCTKKQTYFGLWIKLKAVSGVWTAQIFWLWHSGPDVHLSHLSF